MPLRPRATATTPKPRPRSNSSHPADRIEDMVVSRRAVLAALAVPVVGQDKAQAPPEWRRYSDPATEFDVLRLTNPEWDSVLPASPGRAIDRRGKTVLCASNRGGSWQPWLVDIGGGHSKQIGSLTEMDAASLTFSS